MSGISRPQTASSRRQSMARPTSVSLARTSDDISVLTKGTALRSDARSVATSLARQSKGKGGDFYQAIRHKEDQILDETRYLQEQMTAMESEKAVIPSMESKRDTLTRSILELERQLTDYNLANDRFSRHVLPSELEEANATLAMNNEKLAAELKAVILDTQEQDDNLQALKSQVDSRYREIETRILEEGTQDDLNRFHVLRTLLDNLQEETKRHEEEIGETRHQIMELEGSIEGQRLKEYEALSTKASQLKAKLGCLTEEANALEMPVSEAREILMTSTEAKERSIAMCDQELEQIDLNIENLLAFRDNLLSEIATVELEKLNGGNGLAPRDSMAGVDDGSAYHVQTEHANNHLSPKAELAALEERRMQLEEELVKYDDLVGLQARSDQARDALKKRKKELMEKIAEAKPNVADLSATCAANKTKLESDINWPSLQQMEEKRSKQKKETVSLEEFVEAKGRECEYKDVKSSCLKLARSLNDELVGALQ